MQLQRNAPAISRPAHALVGVAQLGNTIGSTRKSEATGQQADLHKQKLEIANCGRRQKLMAAENCEQPKV